MNEKYVPSGSLQGDTTAMPDRGQSTGVTDTYGANLSGINRMGSLGNAAKSDSAFDRTPAETQGGEK
jgi:hypothetical protein